MSVRDNMGFALKTARMPKKDIAQRVERAAEVLKLDALLDRRPKALSGGQRQRVAIGRAIVREPVGFLFDEPLSNLDAALRLEMRFEIARLHKRLGATMIYVTHDQIEAMTLADRIVVLETGTIRQVGSPRDLYEKPANLFVAQFIGSPKMNILPWEDRQLGIRPEHITLDGGDLEGEVEVAEFQGADQMLYVNCEDKGIVTVRTPGETEIPTGSRLRLGFPEDLRHYFDSDGNRLD
jgi:multiple sugar transport system ATP-binding protein